MVLETIVGIVKEGRGFASGLNPKGMAGANGTISLQKPHFTKAGIPNISNIYNGTINIDISPRKLKITKPDYEIRCTWLENATETFWFVKGQLEYKDKKYDGYIYYPLPSKLKEHSDNTIEFLCEKVGGLRHKDTISIYTSKDSIVFY